MENQMNALDELSFQNNILLISNQELFTQI